MKSLEESGNIIVDCFHKGGVLCGYRDITALFPPSAFVNVKYVHEPSFPRITSNYIKEVFSVINLVQQQGSYVPFLSHIEKG